MGFKTTWQWFSAAGRLCTPQGLLRRKYRADGRLPSAGNCVTHTCMRADARASRWQPANDGWVDANVFTDSHLLSRRSSTSAATATTAAAAAAAAIKAELLFDELEARRELRGGRRR